MVIRDTAFGICGNRQQLYIIQFSSPKLTLIVKSPGIYASGHGKGISAHNLDYIVQITFSIYSMGFYSVWLVLFRCPNAKLTIFVIAPAPEFP